MAELNSEFGNLLTQGLRSIAAREHKAILALEDELGYELEVTRWSIEKWRQGHIPSSLKQISYLANVCVHRGGMDKQWLQHFLTQARFPDKDALIEELFSGEYQLLPFVHHNLPGRPYDRFIGREKEMKELERFLSRRHRLGIICLSGIAGVGKTALALEIAHRLCENNALLPSNERFEAIVWVTAKVAELLHIGLTERNPTFTDLNGLYRAIAEVLDLPAITRAVTIADRDVIVARILSEHRVLLVLDNLEEVDDSALMVFLRDLPTPSKAIVTTRHRIDLAVAIHLKAFNEAEARELIRIECQRRNVILTHEEIEKILRHTGYLALAIVRTIRRMSWRGSSVDAELRQLGNPANTIHDFCFGKSIALIQGRDAHKLFMALALFTTDATRDALGSVAGFGEDILDRDEGLSDLEVLSLVNKEGDRFNLEPLTKVKARAELAANPEFEREARERWMEWYKLLAQQLENTRNYAYYKAEIGNLKSVIDWLIEQKRMRDASWFFLRTRRFFFAVGRWGALVRLAEHVASWGESIEDTELLVEIMGSLIGVFTWQGGLTRGKEWLERLEGVAERLGDEVLQAEIYLYQVKIIGHQSIINQEQIDIVSRALEVFRKHGKTQRIVDALNTLGNLHLKQKRWGEATHFYQQGLQVLSASESDAPEAKHMRAALQGNMGHIAGLQHRFAEACEILMEALKEFTDQTDYAEAYAALALYEYHLGHYDKAHQFRQKADRIIKQLHLIRPICPEDDEWIQLDLAKGGSL